jgi:hypothetical protein
VRRGRPARTRGLRGDLSATSSLRKQGPSLRRWQHSYGGTIEAHCAGRSSRPSVVASATCLRYAGTRPRHIIAGRVNPGVRYAHHASSLSDSR